uniref:1-phosphatidylinositol 3-phosphate 5-kinase-like isoform X2 n=1 Tax=Ictidomys tridecemlineatus TaxID=43179 RepID=UPI001A9F7CE2|nr:1-phosphatidylinositol 3-phosphate 5-kinase-like isoform X2 [Ictidomys tridecemlineatus]
MLWKDTLSHPGLKTKFDDSDTEQIAEEDSASPSKHTSVSSFQSTVDSDSAASISLNMELDNMNFHIKKPSKYPYVATHPADQKDGQHLPRS